MNIEFAIFCIPKDPNFYQFGSKFVGYDLVNGKVFYDQKSLPSAYGLHLTLTDVIGVEEDKLIRILKRTELMIKLYPFKKIILHKKTVKMMPDGKTLAVQYRNSFRLLSLHLLLVLFIQRTGSSSVYRENLQDMNIVRRLKTRLFLSPYIFNDFLPHISLQYDIETAEAMATIHACRDQLNKHTIFEIEEVFLVVRRSNKGYFKILKTFPLKRVN